MTLRQVFAGDRHGVFRWSGATSRRGADPEESAAAAGWRYVLLDSATADDKGSFLDCCAEAFDLPAISVVPADKRCEEDRFQPSAVGQRL